MTSVIIMKSRRTGLNIASDTQSCTEVNDVVTTVSSTNKIFKIKNAFIAGAGGRHLLTLFSAFMSAPNRELEEFTPKNIDGLMTRFLNPLKREGDTHSDTNIMIATINHIFDIEVDGKDFTYTLSSMSWEDRKEKYGWSVAFAGTGGKWLSKSADKMWYDLSISDKEFLRRVLQSAISKDKFSGGRIDIKNFKDKCSNVKSSGSRRKRSLFELYILAFNQVTQAVELLIMFISIYVLSIEYAYEINLAKLKLTG